MKYSFFILFVLTIEQVPLHNEHTRYQMITKTKSYKLKLKTEIKKTSNKNYELPVKIKVKAGKRSSTAILIGHGNFPKTRSACMLKRIRVRMMHIGNKIKVARMKNMKMQEPQMKL